MSRPFTFVHVSATAFRPGDQRRTSRDAYHTARNRGLKEGFGPEYDIAAIRAIDRESKGRWHAEFLTDDYVHPNLAGRGWYGMLDLYNPETPAGADGVIYAAGLDTVFCADLDRLIDGLDAVDADVVGIRNVNSDRWENGVLKIKKGSPGAMAVWSSVLACDFSFNNKLEARIADDAMSEAGIVPGRVADDLVAWYRIELGQSAYDVGPASRLETCAVIVFHGFPRPHQVKPDRPLHRLICEKWNPR